MLSSRPVALHSSRIVNDENATTQSKNSKVSDILHKTPAAASKSRRAFGDISNKRHANKEEAPWKAGVPRTPAGHVEKSTKKSAKKPSVRLFVNQETKRGVSFADKLESSKVLPPEEALLPPSAIAAKTVGAEDEFLNDEDLYDEPEIPLGRTYRQQFENGDHDEEETVLSLEGLDTMAKTWKEFDEKIKLQQLPYEVEFQRRIAEFDQEIEAFGKQDGASDRLVDLVCFLCLFCLTVVCLSCHSIQQLLPSISCSPLMSQLWFHI